MALVWAASAVAAVGGALADGAPTGLPAADVIMRAGFAAAVTLASSKARRWAWLVAGGTAAVTADGGLQIALGAASLALAFLAALTERRTRPLGALIGLLAVQALLRQPDPDPLGLTALIAAVGTTPLLVSGFRRAPRRVRRGVVAGLLTAGGLAALATVGLAVATVLAQDDVRQGINQAQAGFDAARDGDEAGAVDRLLQADAAFGEGHDQLTAPWALPARVVPIVGQHARALQELSGEGQQLSEVAARAADEADVDQLEFQDGVIDLDLVRNFEEPLEVSAAQLSQADDVVTEVDTPWLLPPLASRVDRFANEINEAEPDAAVAMEGVRLAPALFGGEGTRRYLIAFTTPAEMRGLGGFVGNYGELTAVNGDVELTRSGRIRELIPPQGQSWQVSGPEDYLARYGRFDPGHFVQDVTFSPDMPSVAQVLEEIYPQSPGGAPIDGVIVVDPIALAALMEFTGPIPVDGLDQPLTSENAADILLRQQYLTFVEDESARVDFLDEATRETFERLTEGDIPGPRTVVDVLGPLVHEGRLLLHSVHEPEQAYYESVDLDGAFPEVGNGDFLGVTAQNSGNNKIDIFFERSVAYDVRYDPVTGDVGATATITLRNNAPAEGLPPIVIGNQRGVPQGTNRLFLSVYSPHALQGATLDGQPLIMEQQGELERSVYSAFLSVPPGSQVSVVLELEGRVPAGPEYRLQLASQPMVNPEQVAVTLGLPERWRAVTSSDFTAVEGGATAETTLRDDEVLSVDLENR